MLLRRLAHTSPPYLKESSFSSGALSHPKSWNYHIFTGQRKSPQSPSLLNMLFPYMKILGGTGSIGLVFTPAALLLPEHPREATLQPYRVIRCL